MQLKTKSGLKIELPTPEEDTMINAGIAADPDTYELSTEEFAQLRRVAEPKAKLAKERITLRLSQEVTEYFRSRQGVAEPRGRGPARVCCDSSVDWFRNRFIFQDTKPMRSLWGVSAFLLEWRTER